MSPQLLNLDGAAGYLATSARHVRELAYRQELAVTRVGRLVRFRPEDLDEYLARNRTPARVQQAAPPRGTP